MLTTPVHKGNANQNPLRFQVTLVRMTTLKNTTNVDEDEGKKEPSYTVGKNVN
jgi:hypothetical protein